MSGLRDELKKKIGVEKYYEDDNLSNVSDDDNNEHEEELDDNNDYVSDSETQEETENTKKKININDDDDDDIEEIDIDDDENIEEADEEYIEWGAEDDETNNIEIIVKSENRVTSDRLSLFEIIELINIRATQISKGAQTFIDVSELNDPIEMAKKEVFNNKCPLLVKRHIGLSKYELWNPNEMIKPKI